MGREIINRGNFGFGEIFSGDFFAGKFCLGKFFLGNFIAWTPNLAFKGLKFKFQGKYQKIHLMLKYIPYRISLNKVIIILNQAIVMNIITSNTSTF